LISRRALEYGAATGIDAFAPRKMATRETAIPCMTSADAGPATGEWLQRVVQTDE
jgi:hypothetical protein